jgi:hypothetical protein
MHPYLASQVPFQIFAAARLLVEYLFGLGPALLSAYLDLMPGLHFLSVLKQAELGMPVAGIL